MTDVRVSRPRLRAIAAACAAVVLGALAAPQAQAAPADDIRINEVVTTGDVNDSIELYNKGAATVDISGWVLKDDNNSSSYKIPAGTTLAPGAARAFDVHDKFGLGSDDDARLYLANGTTLVDSVNWSSHSDPSWSRCADGTGTLRAAALTLGGLNDCVAATAWPGSGSVSNADAANVFGSDLSGLYQEGGVLWGAQNSGKLWRLVPNGTGGWTPATGWLSGKALRFPGGTGTPDSEGVTVTGSGSAGGVYVASERNGSGSSRLSVLKYDVSGSGSSLTATKEWNLTSGLPAVGGNLGFEGITWIPDATLTAAGFRDESTGAAYNPGLYGAHTGGVFFVGVEGTALVYGYVLQDSGTATRVASIATGLDGVMELQWEPQSARLWVVCDDTCDGEHRTLAINPSGVFATTAVHNRPSGMSNLNNEGFTLAGSSECVGGSKPVYWADDSNTGGHALRKGTINC
ncbi:lamin tail domain-containing protein [Actinokineospora diospyrosa]|uniref:Esterase-like activity of phytase n=1 Tax=Actinokineospora diospyrosa TaxID=103728 RepID=A0ABT1IBF4_9PSEU|nr:lamin tail domain-containing protein [Actinokineospora diospyrosa]MCP2269947.1 Esterase-like activity of phytase [Actinokineospora diospyrosa]